MDFLFFCSQREQHIALYDNSLITITLSYKFGSLDNKFAFEIATDLQKWLSLKTLNYEGQEYKGDIWEKYKDMLIDFNKGFSFYDNDEQGEKVGFGRPFHFSSPPDVVFVNISIGKLFSFLNSSDFYNLLSKENFVSAYAINLKYYYYQQEINIRFYKDAGLDINDVNLFKDWQGYKIDTTKNPGRSTVVSDTWLMAGWKMWFSLPFYKYISKQHLLRFSYAYEIKEMENDLIYIQLYENFNEPHFRKSKKNQHKFLKWINYQELKRNDV